MIWLFVFMGLLALGFLLFALWDEIIAILFNSSKEVQATCPSCNKNFVWDSHDILNSPRPKKGYMVFCPYCSHLVHVYK